MSYFYEKETQDLRSRNAREPMNFPMHIHTNPELLYINQGSIKINYHDKSYILNSGDFAIIFPHTVHGYETISADLDYSLAICGMKLINSYKNFLLENHPVNPVIMKNNLPKDVPNLMNELATSDTFDFWLDKSIIYLILARILPLLELKPNKDSFYVSLAVKVLSYVCSNYRNNITLDVLEKELGCSKFSVSRFFSSIVKIPFTKYVSLLRINYAKKLLETTEKSILEIAMDSGFGSLRNFNRIFKELEKTTPKKYRK